MLVVVGLMCPFRVSRETATRHGSTESPDGIGAVTPPLGAYGGRSGNFGRGTVLGRGSLLTRQNPKYY